MSVWNQEYNDYIMDYWESSTMHWQQKNRRVLNEAIRTYNKYVRNKASLDEVQDVIYYAEDMLRNECGTYMEDIERMKNNVDEIELKRS